LGYFLWSISFSIPVFLPSRACLVILEVEKELEKDVEEDRTWVFFPLERKPTRRTFPSAP